MENVMMSSISIKTLSVCRGRSETMGKSKVCPGPEGTPHFDYPILSELKTVFRLKIKGKLAKGQGLFTLKFYFSKMIIESSQIAHSIGKFIVKTL